MTSWRDYWNGDSPIYVSERHRALHDSAVAKDIAALIPRESAVALDHGCGEAGFVEDMARRCAKLYLCDGAPSIRGRLEERLAGDEKFIVLAPEEIAARIPDQTLDMVVANSLIQYLPREEFLNLLALWKTKLKPGGRLVVGDVVSPDVGALTDAAALLSFGWRGGFFFAALGGLIRTALSDYRKLRERLGLTTYAEANMLALLDGAGYDARRHQPNIGHNPARMTFLAERRA